MQLKPDLTKYVASASATIQLCFFNQSRTLQLCLPSLRLCAVDSEAQSLNDILL